jgi:hypothetical protein
MKMDYNHFWKYHNKDNMDIHAVQLIESQHKQIKDLEAALEHIAEDGCPKCGNVAEQVLKGE